MKYTNYYKFKKYAESRFSGFIVVFLSLLIWEYISRNGIVSGLFLPPASKIIITFFDLITTREFIAHIIYSISRMMAGYTIAVFLGVFLGVFMGSWRRLYNSFEPIIEFLRPIPSIAILPIAILFLGIGNPMKIFIIVYASIWPILINTIDGIKNVDPIQIDTGKVFGLSGAKIIYKIKIPNASPYILSGMRVSLALALILTITAEMVAGVNGLGFYILISQRSFRIPEMYAGVITISLLGYLLNKLFLILEYKFMRWHKESTRQV
jgi:ABC-type nitrate/sulfonate/bicarbonate transport system permease component